MSKLLHKLLGQSKISFEKLERFTSQPGIDVRLTSDIAAKVRLAQRRLGLDPEDTTPSELYGAVQSQLESHIQMLDRRFGWSSLSVQVDFMQRVAGLMKHSGIFDEPVWALRGSTAKKLLKSNPPKKTMKILGYRSIDSLVKRELPGKILALGKIAEGPHWQKKLKTQYKKLQHNDFKTQKIEFEVLDFKKDMGLNSPLAFCYESGTICLLANQIKLTPKNHFILLLEAIGLINQTLEFSSYLKLHQTQEDFGAVLGGMESNTFKTMNHQIALTHTVPYKLLHRHFGVHHNKFLPALGPHVEQSDFSWHDVVGVLSRFEPAVLFWKDLHYVGKLDKDKPISFNFHDALSNYIAGNNLANRTFHNLSQSLHDEVLIRYLNSSSEQRKLNDNLERQFAPVSLY